MSDARNVPVGLLPDVKGLTSRSRSLALATLLFVLFLTFLDNTIVTVVLANVQSDLHASVSQLQWVVNGYALTFASLMLSFGTIGDLLGRKKVILFGVAVFCAGSVIAAVAPTTDILIAGRVVMGIGAAASEPGTLSMIRHLYPDRAPTGTVPRHLGRGVQPRVGPGSAHRRPAGLRLVVAGHLLGQRVLRRAGLHQRHHRAPRELRSGPGPVRPARACSSVHWPSGRSPSASFWGRPPATGPGGSTCSSCPPYSWPSPSCSPSSGPRTRCSTSATSGSPAFATSSVIAFTVYFGTFAIFFMVALYLQVVVGYRPSAWRSTSSRSPSGMVAASIFTGRWVAAGPPPPHGHRLPAGRGRDPAHQLHGHPHVGIGQIGWTMFVAGVGVGMAMVPVTSASLGSVPPEHSGMAASTTNTFRELGAVVGVAVLGSIVNGQLTVNLVRRLTAIGIPKSYQSLVVSAVTTGSYQSESQSATAKSPAITHIVNEVTTAAYGAFGRGLHLSLNIAGFLLLGSAVLALTTVYGRKHPPRTGQLQGWPSAPRLGGGFARTRRGLVRAWPAEGDPLGLKP